MTAQATQLITAEDLLAMGDIGRCELIYGELVMMSPTGGTHGIVALRLGSFLRDFIEAHDLGSAFGAETGFKIDSNPDLVRAPDASFVRKDRMPLPVPDGFLELVPDLAVEVVSPNDTRRELAEKVNMWLAHGTSVVWVAYPKQMFVEIHRVGQPPQRLAATEEIRDEPLLPGFVLPLAKVFKRP